MRHACMSEWFAGLMTSNANEKCNTLSIIKKGNGSETTDSPAQSLPIPARRMRPTPQPRTAPSQD